MSKIKNSFELKSVEYEDLSSVSDSFMRSFPNSFATKLGKKYVAKTFEWFLVNNDCSLYFIKNKENECIGFIGAKRGYGSTSGMMKFAMWQGILAVFMRPWLIFKSEVREHYPLIFSNIKSRIFGKIVNKKNSNIKKNIPSTVGLVVIGVNPSFQGKGYGGKLLLFFDEMINDFNLTKAHLSVKSNNLSAIKAYEKSGWIVNGKDKNTLKMIKQIKNNEKGI